ncbi:MAG: hypothetical protein MI810_00760 [Flavobacteriales bacterium]|nr:hypothetical protein [Flavobacteriales bacterium]
MVGKQHLYYALGEVSYAVAKADGYVQQEERKKIHDIVVEETNSHHLDFDVAEIIFHVLKKDEMDAEISYRWAMKEFEKYKTYLNKDMAIDFIAITQKVANAVNSKTTEEKKMAERFRQDISRIADLK